MCARSSLLGVILLAAISAAVAGKKISRRPGEIEIAQPFSTSTWQTTGVLRDISIRRLDGSPVVAR